MDNITANDQSITKRIKEHLEHPTADDTPVIFDRPLSIIGKIETGFFYNLPNDLNPAARTQVKTFTIPRECRDRIISINWLRSQFENGDHHYWASEVFIYTPTFAGGQCKLACSAQLRDGNGDDPWKAWISVTVWLLG